jgi:hypothetical protein
LAADDDSQRWGKHYHRCDVGEAVVGPGERYLGLMPKPVNWSQSAMDKLVESFSRIRSEAKERMSDEEFRRAESSIGSPRKSELLAD